MSLSEGGGVTAAHQNSQPEEIVALDLDWDLILHLAIADSVRYLTREQVKVDLIEDELAKKVWNFQMTHVREHNEPAKPSVLEDQFSEVTIESPQTAIGDLIGRLRERYIRNKGRDGLRHLADLSVKSPLELSKEMTRYARSLTDLTAKRGEVYGTGDTDRALEEYHRQSQRGLEASLGYQELDDHFNGQRGVTFLMAAPKTYKSWFAVNGLAENVLQGRCCCFYSLELPAADTEWRLLSMAAQIPYWKYLKGALSPADKEAARRAGTILDGYGTYRIEKPGRGERHTERLIERALDNGADCIFIDQLQYVENDKGNSLGALNNTGDYWDALNIMRDYSDDVPIFVVHQFNRSVMNSKGMPEMQQGKGSSAIEEVSTLALGLWASKDMRRNNELEVGTLASRNYGYVNWRLKVDLSTGCSINLLHRIEDDEDEEG